MGIFVESLDVEVGVGGYKIEHVKLLMSEPVFPALVPSFYKNLVKAVLCGEVYIAAHLFVSSPVHAVRAAFLVVGDAEMYRWVVVGVAPCFLAHNHFPPHAAVFCRMYP